MKRVIYHFLGILFIMFISLANTTAQEEAKDIPENKPVKNTFHSIWIFDNPSVMVPIQGTFEFDMQHRFGSVENGIEDLFGLYAPFANVRLGFQYVPINRLMVGFGLTRSHLTWDLNAKYAILQQMQSGGSPVSLSYFVNAAINSENKSLLYNPEEYEFVDRVSYFHQVIVARKFSDRFSAQVAGSVSHYNTVWAIEDDQNQVIDQFENDHIAVAVSAKYKVTPSMNILVNYDQPVTTHEIFDPQPNLSFGVEFITSSHQFQFFLGNYSSITPQENNVFNTNNLSINDDFFSLDGFLIGFNITRLWNF